MISFPIHKNIQHYHPQSIQTNNQSRIEINALWLKRIWKYLFLECKENYIFNDTNQNSDNGFYGNVVNDSKLFLSNWPLLPLHNGFLLRGDLSFCCLRLSHFQRGGGRGKDEIRNQEFKTQLTSAPMPAADEDADLMAAIAASLSDMKVEATNQAQPSSRSLSSSSSSSSSSSLSSSSSFSSLSKMEQEILSLLIEAGIPLLTESDPISGLCYDFPQGRETWAKNNHSNEEGGDVDNQMNLSQEEKLKVETSLFQFQKFTPSGVLNAIEKLETFNLWETSHKKTNASTESSMNLFSPSKWTREERHKLLQWFGTTIALFDAFQLKVLSSLPLFEREDGQFVPIRDCAQPRTIPDDMPGIDLIVESSSMKSEKSFMVFRKKPIFGAIYEALGLAELSEEELYCNHIFPRFHELTTEARLGHLKHALAIAKVMPIAKRTIFKDKLSTIPCVPINGKLEAARDLYDPAPSLPFISLMPEKCVPLELADDWLPALLEAGTASTCNRSSFLSISFEVASSQDATRARALLRLLTKTYRELEMESSNQSETDIFFATIADLPLVNPKRLPLLWDLTSASTSSASFQNKSNMAIPVVWRNKTDAFKLYPLSACCDYSDFDTCWSQYPCIGDSILNISNTLKKLLKMPNTSTSMSPEPIAKHVLWVSKQSHYVLNILNQAKPLSQCLNTCYRSLALSCSIGRSDQSNKDVQSLIASLFHNHAVILRKASTSYASSNGRRSNISRSSFSRSSSQNNDYDENIENDESQSTKERFISGHMIFAYLPFPMSPLALHTSECVSFFHDAFTSNDIYGATTLAKLMNVNMKPKPENVAFWMQTLYDKCGEGAVLSSTDLTLAVNALLTLVDMDESDARLHVVQNIQAPNSKNILVPASQLLVDDAPWLNGRLDLDRINMANELLTNAGSYTESLVEVLGFRRLSSVVQEVLQPGFEPIVISPVPKEIVRWNHVLRSVAFRNGIRQVIRHEKESSSSSSTASRKRNGNNEANNKSGGNSGGLSNSELLKKLFLLESVTVIGCQNIQVSFFVDNINVSSNMRPSNVENVESSDESSDYLLVDNGPVHGKVLYIDTTKSGPRLWVNCVVMAIKHNVLCGEYPQNLLPVCMMIDCASTSDNETTLARKMEKVLRSHRISSIKMSDHLGQPVPQASLTRLNLNQVTEDINFSPGEDVVYVDIDGQQEVGGGEDDNGSTYRYGRLVRKLGDGVWELEDTTTSTRCLRTNQIISLKPSVVASVTSEVQPSPSAIAAISSEEKAEAEQVATQQGDVNRIKYTPSDANWLEKEEAVVSELSLADQEKMGRLEPELPGADEILIKNGFVVKDKNSAAADALSRQTTGSLGKPSIRKGMDLVRVGNLGDSGVAFFFDRRSMPPPAMLTQFLESQVVPALIEVCAVFNYDARFITLFQEPSAASRFVRQRVLINTDPIMKRQEELANKGKHGDIREDPFIYCYLYGIMIHKLGHFHDIVHGTRHDYFMNELRIEFMELWIELLEKHSFDPAFLESSEEFRWMLKQLTPGQTVN